MKVYHMVSALEQSTHQVVKSSTISNWRFTWKAEDFYITLPFEYLIILKINHIECNRGEQDSVFTL